MEIVKIRMQVAGEINRSLARSERTIQVVRELGFFGLYKVSGHEKVAINGVIVIVFYSKRVSKRACSEIFHSR